MVTYNAFNPRAALLFLRVALGVKKSSHGFE